MQDDLDRLKQDYQDYSYIVSHDLSAPLRQLREFSRLFIESIDLSLSEEQQEYVRFMNRALNNLEHMQEALLQFSRISTRPGPCVETDLNTVIKDVLANFEDEISKKEIDIQLQNLPTLKVYPNQIKNLFSHLIDNALKFSNAKFTNRFLKISVQEKEGAWVFEFKDNGIGIAQDHHEDIFKMFRRLHPKKYDGIGAGLALSKKIAELHGGKIWVQPSEDIETIIQFSILSN